MRLSAFFWLLLASVASADEAFVDAVLDCRTKPSAEQRLSCYDGVVDGYAVSGTKPVAGPAESAADSAVEPVADTAVDSEDLFGMSPAAAQRVLEESTGRESIDRVEATVVELMAVASNKVAVVLDNGQVWRQTTTSSLRLAEGDDVVIQRRSLGSHALKKTGSARSMKVRRVK